MIKLAVYGNQKWSLLMKDLIENEYSKYVFENGEDFFSVETLVVDNPISINEISVDEFSDAYQKGELSAIVIPKEYYIKYNDIVLSLIRNGVDVEDIYNGIRLFDEIREHPEYIKYLIKPMLDDSYLSYLEYHVADHCNLNCKYCTHYSPLVKTPVFTDIDELKNGLLQLKKYISDIGVIRILGGEPTLNPQLVDFIECTREIYPGTIITVVTNGLMLDKIDSRLIETMKNTKAFFFISYYPPLETKIRDIQSFLVDNKIPYSLSPEIERFNKTQTLDKNNNPDFFYSCFQATCTCIHGGKIASCYAPFTTKYFNEAFGTDLPTDEGIDLYDAELTLQALKMRLLIPMQRCDYCISGESYKWQVIGKNSDIGDWV